MKKYDTVVVGDIVTHERIILNGYVGINSGIIEEVGSGKVPEAHAVLDYSGCWILPGVIDGQVHSRSQKGQEDFLVSTRAAAAGGVTTVVDMPYDDPLAVDCEMSFNRKVEDVEQQASVDCALYATISPDNGVRAIPELIDAGACAFKFSTYEAHPTRFPRVSDDVLFEAFKMIRPSGLACGVHNQDHVISGKNILQFKASNDVEASAWGRALPTLVEDLATARVYELGALTGARAHAVHVSTGRGFELRNMYRAHGHHASVETCIQYLMLDEEDMVRLGAKAKHYPPIRTRDEVEKLWKYIAKGECDFVSSDHVSWGLEKKSSENIFECSAGGPGLETLLPAFFTGCQSRGISPTIVAKMLAKNPADHFLLKDKGNISTGFDADLVVLEKKRVIHDASQSLSAVKWSSFDGFEFSVRVACSMVRGTIVWDGKEIKVPAGFGKFVRPASSM